MGRNKKVILTSNKDIAKNLIKGLSLSKKIKDKIMIFCEFKMRWYAEEIFDRWINKEISQKEAIYLLTTVEI